MHFMKSAPVCSLLIYFKPKKDLLSFSLILLMGSSVGNKKYFTAYLHIYITVCSALQGLIDMWAYVRALLRSSGRDIELFSLHFFISLPQDSKSFPQDRKSFPQVSKSLPQDTKSFPQVRKLLPQVSKVVPTRN